MNISHIPQRIEIAFWVTLVSLMKESGLVAFVIRQGYAMMNTFRALSSPMKAAIWSASGLGLGFLLGLMVSLVR